MPPRDGPPAPSDQNLTSSPLSSLHSATPTAASPRVEGDTSLDHDSTVPVPDDGQLRDDGLQSDTGALPQYYKAKALPPELREHCRVYLEEALPRQAIFLLDSLLSTRSPNLRESAFCPPPSQISLLCSIIVHPDFTNRPKEPDWPQISLQSLVYLRDLLVVCGPLNAGFKESVLFGASATPDLESDAAQSGGLDADERGLVRLYPRHGNDSVWQRGRDFFSVVGWAFNCSSLYPGRWQWWSRWLGFMLDLLEKDLELRYSLDMENGSDDCPLLQESILASYITQRSGRTADAVMWITKALFADGDTPSTSVFQEVWHREHKGKSQRAVNKRKREKVNVDRGEYGGYLDDESVHSSQASEPPTPQKNRVQSLAAGEDVLDTAYVETIPLRQRLFSLVSYLCYNLGNVSPIEFSNLYQKFEQRVKELPLPLFASFVNSSTSALRIDQQIEMLQGVLFLFMPPSAPSPRKVDRVRFEQGGISPAILERCFLPYPANTIEVEDNAKMSLLLENLLMIVWRHGEEGEEFTARLVPAVKKGVEARREKINKKKPRGRARVLSDSELAAKVALEASDARLDWLAGAIMDDVEARGENVMDEDADCKMRDDVSAHSVIVFSSYNLGRCFG
ncbi:hypothetical protein F4802DRAFT_606077 [Xylaria palmicola]|nr:hypothetical protein F4802DRAFT_606077 [Xylaria palmicola]